MQHAHKADREVFNAKGWRVGVVVAEFNAHITDQLYESALNRAADYKLEPADIDTIKVAGAVEIPVALQRLAASGRYRALLAVGCVIQGETPHFDYVCKLVSEGVLRVQLDYKLPIAFGVLTCHTEAQAKSRAHLGGEHLDAALQLARALEETGL